MEKILQEAGKGGRRKGRRCAGSGTLEHFQRGRPAGWQLPTLVRPGRCLILAQVVSED
jgi:hypothetical protein